MNDILITVVVPVYKVEQYIDKCLNSLIVPEDQLPLLEVLVVNDGTPDNSAKMAKEFEKRYPNVFRVIDKENGGHGSAWNRGLKEAKGKYVRFLDSDDWFNTSEFSRIISRLETLDVDVVISHYNRFYVQTGETVKQRMFAEDLDQSFSEQEFDWNKLDWWDQLNFWGCTYRTEMLRRVFPLFMEGVYYDDFILFIAPVILSERIHVFNATIYNYLIGRPGQTMDPSIRKRNMEYWALTRFQVFDFCSSNVSDGMDSKKKDHIFRFLRFWVNHCLARFSECPYKQAKDLSSRWEVYFERLSSIFTTYDLKTPSIKLYYHLPFFIYYYSRGIFSRLSSLIKFKRNGE